MTLVAPLIEDQGARQGEGLASLARRGPDLAALVDALANRFSQRGLARAVPSPSVMPERSVAFARVGCDLLGSLAWTGEGHATDKAVILGLAGFLPDGIEPELIDSRSAEHTSELQSL